MKRLLSSQACLFLINLTVATALYSAGDAGDEGVKQSKSIDPSYAPLEERAGKYRAKVYDEASVVDLCEISFFGHTTVGGVRKESDDSMNKLDLAFIKEIIIKKPDFESGHYPDKSFSLADIVTDTGVRIEDMLLPKHIIICGKENNTHIQKSWFLNKISRVTIEQPVEEEESAVAKKYVERIFKKEERSKPEAKNAIKNAIKEEIAGVKKEVDEVKRETAVIKRLSEDVTREVASVKAGVQAEVKAEVKKEVAQSAQEKKEEEQKEAEKKEEEKKEIVIVKEVQKAVTPIETREQPAISEHTSVKDAFVHLFRLIVDFGKSIVHFVMQLLPV